MLLLRRMGEIVIEIPAKSNRRYKLTKSSSVKSLIDSLDANAVRIEEDPSKQTKRQIEDRLDGERADKILKANRRFYSQSEIEQMLGI